MTQNIDLVNDVHECLELCRNNKDQDCSWISYDSESKFCYQYDNCKCVLTEDKENFLSSETTCPSYECNKIGYCQVRSKHSSIFSQKTL